MDLKFAVEDSGISEQKRGKVQLISGVETISIRREFSFARSQLIARRQSQQSFEVPGVRGPRTRQHVNQT